MESKLLTFLVKYKIYIFASVFLIIFLFVIKDQFLGIKSYFINKKIEKVEKQIILIKDSLRIRDTLIIQSKIKVEKLKVLIKKTKDNEIKFNDMVDSANYEELLQLYKNSSK